MEESNWSQLLQLSDLPESILIEILSNLPTKDAAITTFLSRRWRFLWTAITRLDFDETDQFPGKRRSFLKFVDTAMNSREQEDGSSSLVSFSLKCNVHFAASRINTWIVAAVSCINLQELSLSLRGIYHEMSPYMLPASSIFMCGTLRKLTLDIKCMLKIPGASSFCLDKINYLKLRGLEFADDESAEKLMSCPLLEELILESCNWNNIKNVRVYSPRLRLLTIIDDSVGKTIGLDRINTNLQELSLSLGGIYDQMSPYNILPASSCIFMCETETLTKVYIDIKCILKVPAASSSFCLAKINYLKLRGVEFADDESAEKLMSCPLLEELILESCNWNNVKNVRVYAPRLRLLTIDDSEGNTIDGDRTVTIVAEHLKRFHQKGQFINEYNISSSIHLDEAQIMADVCCWGEEVECNVTAKRVCKLLKCFSGVKNITLGKELVTVFNRILKNTTEEFFDSSTLPVFHRMTVFKFRGDPCTSLLYRMLQKSPHLEILEIQSFDHFEMMEEKLRPQLPSCFRTHLKRITIFSFHSYKRENFLVGVILSIAAVLEEMVVHYVDGFLVSDGVSVKGIEDSLNMMPRASRDCRISVVLVPPRPQFRQTVPI